MLGRAISLQEGFSFLECALGYTHSQYPTRAIALSTLSQGDRTLDKGDRIHITRQGRSPSKNSARAIALSILSKGDRSHKLSSAIAFSTSSRGDRIHNTWQERSHSRHPSTTIAPTSISKGDRILNTQLLARRSHSQPSARRSLQQYLDKGDRLA